MLSFIKDKFKTLMQDIRFFKELEATEPNMDTTSQISTEKLIKIGEERFKKHESSGKTREEWMEIINSYLNINYQASPKHEREKINQYIESLSAMAPISAIEADEAIEKCEKEFESIMNTGNSFKEKMVEQAEKFGRWTSLVTDILKNSREVRNDISALNELDSALDELNDINEKIVAKQKSNDFPKTIEVIQIDLIKSGFDLNKWEDTVKPVKAFLTIKECEKNETFKFAFEICDMMLLMEDGTFQHTAWKKMTYQG